MTISVFVQLVFVVHQRRWAVELHRHVPLNGVEGISGESTWIAYLHVLFVAGTLAVDAPGFTLQVSKVNERDVAINKASAHACMRSLGTRLRTLRCLSRHWLSKSPSEAPQKLAKNMLGRVMAGLITLRS